MRHVRFPTRWQVSGPGAFRPKRHSCQLNRVPELSLCDWSAQALALFSVDVPHSRPILF